MPLGCDPTFLHPSLSLHYFLTMQPTLLSSLPTASNGFLQVCHACPSRRCHHTRGSLGVSNGLALSSTTLVVAHTRAAALLLHGKISSGSNDSKNRRGPSFRLALGPVAQISEKKAIDSITTWPSPTQSLGIVITGGSKGLGFALARKFLELKDRVIICGRDEKRLSDAISALQQENAGAFIDGIACDVSNSADVEKLSEFAAKRLGVIDRWLNNAGEVTAKKLLADLEADEIVRVSKTNVVGSLLCCREAIRSMREQSPSSQPIYHIFNMGFSRWGAKFTKSACTHKATKVALSQLTESLCEELKTAGSRIGSQTPVDIPWLAKDCRSKVARGSVATHTLAGSLSSFISQLRISSIGVHNLSPGLVLTDLLLRDSTPIARRFFNTLAEEPETVARILAPEIRAVKGSGRSVDVLSPLSAVLKVISGSPQIIFGGRFFDKNGNRVVVAGKTYHDNGVEVMY